MRRLPLFAPEKSRRRRIFSDDTTPDLAIGWWWFIYPWNLWISVKGAGLLDANLELNPVCENWYVFCNRQRDQVKLLYQERSRFSFRSMSTKIKDQPSDDRYDPRQWEVKTPLADICTWLELFLANTHPASSVARALHILNKQRDKLIRYFYDGHPNIDSSPTARALRPLPISRNNWLIVDTVQGAKVSAQPCKAWLKLPITGSNHISTSAMLL